MKVLVTGGSGFIGQPIMRALARNGHEVDHYDRSDGGDVLDQFAIRKAMKGFDVVVHLAGVLGTAELLESIPDAIDVNIKGTVNVLAAARDEGARYVGITMPDCWPSVYQATKLAATRFAEAFRHAYDLPVVHVRTFNVYGPGQAFGPGHPQKIVPTFAVAAHRRKPLPIWGSGRNTVDLVHVDDVASTFLTVVERLDEFDGRTVDCGSGHESRVLDVAAHAALAADWPEYRINWLPMRAGETEETYLCANPHTLIYPGTPYELDERFSETIEWYRSRA